MTSQGAPLVLMEERGHVAIFTLNRPKAMNAVSGALSQCFELLLDKFEAVRWRHCQSGNFGGRP